MVYYHFNDSVFVDSKPMYRTFLVRITNA